MSLRNEEVRKKLTPFLERYINLSEVKDEENLIENGLVNSLFFMQLVLFLENKFNITLDPADIDPTHFSSVQNIISFIETKQ